MSRQKQENSKTRKVKRTKVNKHNNVFLRSLKYYTVNVFVEKLQKVSFLNYERFSCLTDFLNKLMKVVNEIAPSKEIRIKNNTQEWLDREISELSIPVKNCLKCLESQSFTLMKKITKKWSIKFKILLGKRNESSIKLILDKK